MKLCTHLVNMEVGYLKELVAVFCHFWDLDVQLQILYRKVSKILDLRHNRGNHVNYFQAVL